MGYTAMYSKNMEPITPNIGYRIDTIFEKPNLDNSANAITADMNDILCK